MILFCFIVYYAIFVDFQLTLIKSDNKLQCISTSNDSTALAWVLQDASSKIVPQISAGWLPTSATPLSSLSCDLLTTGHCVSWSGADVISNLHQEHLANFGPVLDYRWNLFPLYRTDGSLTFVKSIKIPHTDTLQFHISVLTYDNANFVLSRGADQYSSYTYWIIVDHGSDKMTIIRRCPSGVNINGSADAECTIVQAQKEFDNYVLKKGKEWAHLTFKLSKTQSGQRIEISHGATRLVDWTDTRSPSSPVKYLSFRNYFSRLGYWRLNQYDVLPAELVKNQYSIRHNEPIHIASDVTMCLSVTYYSKNGDVTLEIWTTPAEALQYVKHEDLKLPRGEGWKVQRVQLTLKGHATYKFQMSSPHSFYLGDARVCESNGKEGFMTTILDKVKATCVALKSPTSSISLRELTSTSQPAFGCLEDQFGPECSLSCTKSLGRSNCKDVVTCSQTTCSCLSGYQGNNCSSLCASLKYGPGCKEHCSANCASLQCDATTGHCIGGCKDAFVGHKCDLVDTTTSTPGTAITSTIIAVVSTLLLISTIFSLVVAVLYCKRIDKCGHDGEYIEAHEMGVLLIRQDQENMNILPNPQNEGDPEYVDVLPNPQVAGHQENVEEHEYALVRESAIYANF